MRPKNYFVLTLIIVLYTTCNSQSKEGALKVKLDSLFESEFNQNTPGGSILLKKGDKVVFQENYGLADLETGEPITENTVFNTGSISKTFVSNAILILQEKQKLSIEDNLSIYFDDFKNQSISDAIKIKHLLSHTSGLPDNRNVQDNYDFYLNAKDVENFEPLKQTDKLNFQPGENFEYSNPSFNALALIIEKTTKNKWQNFIVENIFVPSEMVNSTITDGPHPRSGVAHGYILKNGQYIENDYGEVPTFAAAGNGGVWSTVLDLARYEQSLKSSKFLNADLLNESRSVYKPDNWQGLENPKIGYSWFITPKVESRHKMDMIYHTGSQGGFNSYYAYFPSVDVLYIGLFNRPLGSFWDTALNGVLDIVAEHNWLND